MVQIKLNLVKDLLSQLSEEVTTLEGVIEQQASATAQPEPERTPRKDIRGIRALANYLQISTATAQKMKNEHRIPFYTIGDRTFFNPDAVDAAVKTPSLTLKGIGRQGKARI